jgi:hypothetical protein
MKNKIYRSIAGTSLMLPFVLFFISITFTSCSLVVPTYLRNFTNEITVVDIFFLNKSSEHTHTDSVKVANSIIDFDSDYLKSFDNAQKVLWVDANHMSFEIHPNTSVNLWDVGAFVSPYTSKDFTVTLTRGNKSDTIADGTTRYRNKNIQVKQRGMRPIGLYYDIKD